MFGKSTAQVIQEAMEAGARIALEGVKVGREATLEALYRQGKIHDGKEREVVDGPVHIDDFEDYENPKPVESLDFETKSAMEARAARFAEQMFKGGVDEAK